VLALIKVELTGGLLLQRERERERERGA